MSDKIQKQMAANIIPEIQKSIEKKKTERDMIQDELNEVAKRQEREMQRLKDNEEVENYIQEKLDEKLEKEAELQNLREEMMQLSSQQAESNQKADFLKRSLDRL